MEIQLRDYQEEAVAKLRKEIAAGNTKARCRTYRVRENGRRRVHHPADYRPGRTRTFRHSSPGAGAAIRRIIPRVRNPGENLRGG